MYKMLSVALAVMATPVMASPVYLECTGTATGKSTTVSLSESEPSEVPLTVNEKSVEVTFDDTEGSLSLITEDGTFAIPSTTFTASSIFGDTMVAMAEEHLRQGAMLSLNRVSGKLSASTMVSHVDGMGFDAKDFDGVCKPSKVKPAF